jgi:predicted 2-oxoglutarate/Fe(II)-dependent dioxygenase YbiX
MNLIQKKVFTEKECQYILSFLKNKKWIHSSEHKMEYKPDWSDKKIKVRHNSKLSCSEVEINPTHSEYMSIVDYILPKLSEEGIKSIGNLYFIKYDTGDYMGRHKDTGGGYSSSAKRSVSLQLTDGKEYEGGDLIINDDIIAEKEIGTLISFDSQKYHEITKVENGVRISLVIFLKGQDLEIKKTIT